MLMFGDDKVDTTLITHCEAGATLFGIRTDNKETKKTDVILFKI